MRIIGIVVNILRDVGGESLPACVIDQRCPCFVGVRDFENNSRVFKYYPTAISWTLTDNYLLGTVTSCMDERPTLCMYLVSCRVSSAVILSNLPFFVNPLRHRSLLIEPGLLNSVIAIDTNRPLSTTLHRRSRKVGGSPPLASD